MPKTHTPYRLSKVSTRPSTVHPRRQLRWSVVTALAAFTSSDARAVEADDLFEMGLQELMTVQVASTEPESILKTPAIVSSYSKADLEAVGIRSLRDLLSFVPGMLVQSSNIPMDSIMVRGVSETFNQKILMLIDDVPYWGPSHSQIPLLGVPWEAIDRVEIIRGPGAVIYGTNASAGVIKIITKKSSEDNTAAFSVGSHRHVNGGGYYTLPLGDEVTLSVGFQVQRERGYLGQFDNDVPVPWLPDDQQTSGQIREKMEMTAAFAKLQAGAFTGSAQLFDSLETGSLGAAPTHPAKPAQGTSSGYLLHGDYQWDMDRGRVRTYSDYNIAYTGAYELDYQGPGGERRVRFANRGRDNYRWRTGVDGTYKIADPLTAFAGAEYEYRSVGDYDLSIDGVNVLRQLDKTHSDEANVFAQLDVVVGPLRALAGARYINNQNAGAALAPRGSIVLSLHEKHSLKLLYSQGFNSPNFLQTHVDLPFIVGRRDLQAETIRTYDLAYTHLGTHNLLVVNAYRLEARDFIGRVPSEDDGPLTYDNDRGFDRHGVELDVQQHLGPVLLQLNGAVVAEGNSVDPDDVEAAHVPLGTVNAAARFRLGKGHSAGSSARYVGPRVGVEHYLIWNVDYQVRREGVEGHVSLRNLLNSAGYSRDVAGFSPQPVPVADPKLSLLLGLRYHF